MLPARTIIGIGVTAATVAALVIGYFRRPRQRRFPTHGWLGLMAFAVAEGLLSRRIEPVTTYFTPIAWTTYILIADAAVLALTGRSRLSSTPVVVAWMALLSIPLWLIFEAYNLRLHNWTYVGVPAGWTAVVFGYGWSFATITPAIFETSDLVQALVPPRLTQPWTISHSAENVLIACGAICLIAPLATPPRIGAYLFGVLWVGFLLLLDPVNCRLGLPSFLGDLSEGYRSRAYSFLLSGWICGWLWEFWNNWAGAKWHYTFPILQGAKIFEMPAIGYLGFLPFAMECFTMYVTAAWLVGWLKRVK